MSPMIEEYLAEVRRTLSNRTHREYAAVLSEFDRELKTPLSEVTSADCRRFLSRWQTMAPSTLAHRTSIVNQLFAFLVAEGKLPTSPMANVRRPRVQPPDELAVVTVDAHDVRRLLDAAATWQERLCVAVLVYMGPRRHAASELRWRDVDLDAGLVTFYEKGGKTIVKPMPAELVALFVGAREHYQPKPADHVIANHGAAGDARDDRIVYRTVKHVARRAGIETHVHSLRAAFATHYLEANPGDIHALKQLMGHGSILTTDIYLRRLNRQQAMERVRGLSW